MSETATVTVKMTWKEARGLLYASDKGLQAQWEDDRNRKDALAGHKKLFMALASKGSADE